MSIASHPRQTVKHLTYYAVRTYKAAKNGLSADDPTDARDRDHALRLFERYKDRRAGVVAFWRVGDPRLDEWQDAVIIARHGRLPADFDHLQDEADLEFVEQLSFV